MRIWTHGIIWASALTLITACGEKKDGKSDDKAVEGEAEGADGATDAEADGTDGADGDKTGELSDNIKVPAGSLALALDSMGSIGSTNLAADMVGAGAGLAEADGLTVADCTEHGEAKARETDAEEFKDNSGRLRMSHPRATITSLYCQMQMDSGSPDTFLGALSTSKLFFCLLHDLKFDGQTEARKIKKTEFLACLDKEGASQQDKDDFTGNMPDELETSITAAAPAAFGKAGEWDASIDFRVETMDVTLKILLKDSDDVLALAVNDNGGHPTPTDGYVFAINKKSGEVRFESKFQRIRDATAESTGNVGWTRHARVYVKGAFGEDLKFTKVDAVEGAYSDISVNGGSFMGADANAPIQMGTFWTAKGSDATGFKTNAYELTCAGEMGEPMVCEDANKAASWVATEGSGACNGEKSGNTTCTGEDIAVDGDVDTSSVMEAGHADFEITEDWAKALALPAYTTVELLITQ